MSQVGTATICLGSAVVSMQTGAAQTIFTVPTGKKAYISHVTIRSPSGSLAGGTSYSFTQYRQTVDLSGITTTAGYRILDANNQNFTELAAGTAFQITPTTGTAGAATATIEVFGYYI